VVIINTIDRESVRKYFPTATSHFLGLDTHDIGDYRAPLQPGMVLTVEPGIYIPEEGIGVRIEDDVLITEAGNKNLSAKLPSLII
jgi:Xaa-Pro aminopeptidase